VRLAHHCYIIGEGGTCPCGNRLVVEGGGEAGEGKQMPSRGVLKYAAGERGGQGAYLAITEHSAVEP
jgi:hypothetical protein